MKHGDKAKAKTAKAKAGKKSSPEKSSKGKVPEKVASKAKSGGSKEVSKEAGKAGSKDVKGIKAGKKTSAPEKAGGNGKARPVARLTTGEVTFTNAAVGAAFKRAIKKYNNAFRRLTD
jgi:hypothetical protein